MNTNVLKQSLIRLGKVFELHMVISQNSGLPQKDENGSSPWALLSFDALFDTLTFTSAFCFKIWQDTQEVYGGLRDPTSI